MYRHHCISGNFCPEIFGLSISTKITNRKLCLYHNYNNCSLLSRMEEPIAWYPRIQPGFSTLLTVDLYLTVC